MKIAPVERGMDGDAPDSEVVNRQFDPTDCNPYVVVAEVVAELEDEEPNDLSPLYARVNEVIGRVFADSVDPEAKIQVTFWYEGYRITVHQDGNVEFAKG